MRILILGATGPTGILVIRQALKEYQLCTIVLYVRSPEKVPNDLLQNPSIIIIEGQLDNHEMLSKAIEGVDIVVSALGPSVKKGPFHPSGTPLANAYLGIIEIMHQYQVKRLICLGTASITDPSDKFNLAFSVLVNGVATLARNAYKDVVAIGENIRTKGADLDWTIVRVPILTQTESTGVIAGYVGDGKTNTFLARLGFASFVIREIEKKEWVRKAPLICSS
ncbi:NAD-P-binding protein [Collybia nuda]|uniref:NAD-P-binding protein n=1 Tax=Collybia nuda TaxID=64659 RepID=A0A9P5XY63_9AGAR|nr:NAD-P-binding protein [Collybia nuda]